MKKIKLIFVLIATVVMLTCCKNEKQEKAQKSLDVYTAYVDSVSGITTEEANANWEIIENDYAKLKADAESALADAADKTKLQSNLTDTETKYEQFKNNITAEKEKSEANDAKTDKYKIWFGTAYVHDDMKFNWVNKDNILSVYDNFVNTVHKNKDSYSREDWDEIKLLYEALDTRKNTVEKEGLTSHDNNKIALLKLKFAPMYTINRTTAKSKENAEAKK
jgi:hypothetical protein